MPKVPKVSFWRKKKVVTIGVVIVLIASAAATGVYIRWWQSQNTGNSGSNNSGNLDGLSQNSLPDSVQDAQNLAATGKTDESNRQISAGIANSTDNDEKYELYIQQGLNYENTHKWAEALTAYKSAEAIKKSATVYIALGRASEGKGDKQAAIDYYKQAIPLLNAQDPLYNAEKGQLEDNIRALGGSV